MSAIPDCSIPNYHRWTIPAVLVMLGLSSAPAHAGDSSTTLRASAKKTVFSEPVTLSATVTGVEPTGTINVRADGKSIGKATLPDDPVVYSAVSGGRFHACALIENGNVQCWGNNGPGQLGNGTTKESLIPVSVIGLAGPVEAIEAQGVRSCALIKGGTVQCWGYNGKGILGNGTTDNSPLPVSVLGLSGPVTSISAGTDHTCALIEGGAIQCWGRNVFGELGDGTTKDSPLPVTVVGLSGPAKAVAAAGFSTCAVIEDDSIQCWGARFRSGPREIVKFNSPVLTITAGSSHFCALISEGTVTCWGSNTFGTLGDGTDTSRTEPVSVKNLDGLKVTTINAGVHHTCAVIEGGVLRCWGANFSGAIGDGTTTDRFAPVSVDGIGGPVLTSNAGGYHFSCAVLATGRLQCWGANNFGQLGDGTKNDRLTPVDVLPGSISRTTHLTVKAPEAGKHSLVARYRGDAENNASRSDPFVLKVSKAKTEIGAIKIKPKAGNRANVRVSIKSVSPATAKPRGTMSIKLDGKNLGKVTVENGRAAFRLKHLAQGRHELKVQAKGVGNFKKSRTATKTFEID